jgi:hypothetical protein
MPDALGFDLPRFSTGAAATILAGVAQQDSLDWSSRSISNSE